MDEKENLSINTNRKEKISIIRRIYKGHKNMNIKVNKKIIVYISLIFVFILIFSIIFILFLENKQLIQMITENNFKYNHIEKQTLKNFNFINNNGQNVKFPKELFHYKDDDMNGINKNKIHVSYSLDNQLIFPTLVSMVSGLENCDKEKNILIYHLLFSHDFNTSKIYIFESLKEDYEVKINYYVIPHIFSYSSTWTAGTDCVYYKILLPLMFPDLERMIYIDGDTLIRKDIYEMYNYPFNDNYILGFPFYMTYVMDVHGINATHYINGGCLLFNIDKIRKDHKDVDLLQFTLKNNSVLRFREQDSINYIFHPNIGFLPLKYGIYMIGSERAFDSLSRYTRSPLNITEGHEAVHDPAIVHFSCCWPKVWNNGSKNLFKDDDICLRYKEEFYYYANKTRFYSEIYNTLYLEKKE